MKRLRRRKSIYQRKSKATANKLSSGQAIASTVDYWDYLKTFNYFDYSDFCYAISGGRSALRHFLFSIQSLSIWIIVLGYTSFLLLNVPDFNRVPSTARTIIAACLMGSTINPAIFFLRLMLNREKAKTDPRYVATFISAMFISNLASATAFAAAFLYYFGVVDFVAATLQKIWPYLSDKVSYAVSTVLSWIASGIIGNTAFHLIKNRFGGKGKTPHSADGVIRRTRT